MKEEVKITKIQMPFWNMVLFIIKWILATFVALLILMALFMVVSIIINMFTEKSLNINPSVGQYSSYFYSYQHSK